MRNELDCEKRANPTFRVRFAYMIKRRVESQILEALERTPSVALLGPRQVENSDKLIVLDEVQRLPEIFAPLRGIIDQERRKGNRVGQFLFLGSACRQ